MKFYEDTLAEAIEIAQEYTQYLQVDAHELIREILQESKVT